MSQPVVLVTGGAGFLGQHLAARLSERGLGVVTFDVEPPARPVPGTTDETGDVADRARVAAVLRAHRPSVVVHLAALLTDACEADPVRAAHVNAVGTAAVFDAAARHGVRRVVFGSSVAALAADPGLPTGDDRPLGPTSVYGATKAYVEHLAAAMRRLHPAVEFVGLRFGWIYGPGRARGWTGPQQVIEAFALEQPVVTYPDYQHPLDWTHVDDAVEVLVRCVQAPSRGWARVAYNVAGDRRRVRDAVVHLQRRFPRVQARRRAATLPPAGWAFTTDGIEHQIGFRPRITLEPGLDRAVDAVRSAHGLPPLRVAAALN